MSIFERAKYFITHPFTTNVDREKEIKVLGILVLFIFLFMIGHICETNRQFAETFEVLKVISPDGKYIDPELQKRADLINIEWQNRVLKNKTMKRSIQ